MEDIASLVDDMRSGDLDRALKAAEKISKLRDVEYFAALHPFLDDDDWWIRETVSEPLIRMKGVSLLPELLAALQRGNEDGHDNDSLALFITDLVSEDPEGAGPTIVEYMSDPEPVKRCQGAWLAGFAHEAVPVGHVKSLLKDRVASVRAEAVGAISSYADSIDAFSVLVAALKDRASAVRQSAVSSLGYLGNKTAVPHVRKAKRDRSPDVRRMAREALKVLEGMK